MLRGIQEASKNWLGKVVMAVVMGLLVISFAIWGIGDIFRGFGLSTVAKIGKTEIGIEQFRTYYNERLQALSRRMGRPITPDQARALGLDRQLIGQLIAETALDERARDLRLTLSNEEIAQQIVNDKNFAGPSGQFDRNRFEAIIRNAGYSESRFVAEQRRTLVRRELTDTIAGGITPPNALIAAIQQFQNETRTIRYLSLGPAQAGEIAAPTADELAKYFEERKVLFRAPEYRSIVLVELTPDSLAQWQTISDADARKVYDENPDKFGTPERRHLRQILFPNADEAKAASEKIAGGATFESIAEQRGLKDTDTDLGTLTKAGIVDPAIATAAFALKEGDVSAPVQGRFGTVLIKAVKIEPGQMKSFELAAPEIKKELALNKARGDVIDTQNKIEDARAGGATLAEAAQKVGLTPRTIEAVDRSGRGTDGAPVPNLPKNVDVLSQAFATQVGIETDPVQIPGGGYLWYEVTKVTPSRERNLDEVKPQVETRWKDDQIARKLKEKADDIVAKLKAGGKIDEIASANGVTAETAADLKRNTTGGAVPASVVDLAFRTAKDTPVASEGARPTEMIVFAVTAVNDPKFDAAAAETKQMADGLKPALTESLLAEYVAQLQVDYGVSINPTVFNQIVGGGTAAN
jgi:peptidyl-prolyl cis-trans isomerase D